MNSNHERRNLKARRPTQGSRKKGKLRHKNNDVVDPNAAILEHKSLEDKERDRKERLLQEVCQ